MTGQEEQIELVRKLLESGRFPSGLLISGPRGSGKKTFARLIAKGLLCAKGRFNDACDCNKCHKVDLDAHTDLLWVGRDEKENSVKIQEIHRLAEWVSLKPAEGERKIAVITGSERLTEEAANSLLKTLEEPPLGTHLILLSENPFYLRETLLSRCVRIKMSLLSIEELKRNLRQRGGIEPENIDRVAYYSQGSLGKALELKLSELDEIKNFFIHHLFLKPAESLETWAAEERKDVLLRLEMLTLFLRDMLIWKETADRNFLYDKGLATHFTHRLPPIGAEGITRLLDLLEETYAAVEQNANAKIALFRLGIHFEEIFLVPSSI